MYGISTVVVNEIEIDEVSIDERDVREGGVTIFGVARCVLFSAWSLWRNSL